MRDPRKEKYLLIYAERLRQIAFAGDIDDLIWESWKFGAQLEARYTPEITRGCVLFHLLSGSTTEPERSYPIFDFGGDDSIIAYLERLAEKSDPVAFTAARDWLQRKLA